MSTDAFLARYAERKTGLGDLALRERAAGLLRAKGLPGPRDEAWRYTRLLPLTQTDFVEPRAEAFDASALLARLPAIDAPRLVFVDARCIPPRRTSPASAPGFRHLASAPGRTLTRWWRSTPC